MSKARNISNLFSASTDVATDAEVTAVLTSHSSSLTSRHYKYGNLSSRPSSPTAGELYFNTEKKAFEVWTEDAWVSVAVNGAVPLAPTIGTVTVSGLTASVPFTGPIDFGDSAISTYTATSNPGSITASNATSPISVSGLSANTAYTFTVTATNSFGVSNASSASNSITTANVPGVSTSVTAVGTSTDGEAAVSWTAPASNGGSAITDYTIQYSSNSGSTWTTFNDGTSTSTSATVTGLTIGTAYIFRVAAVNAIGTGSYSDSSSSYTPVANNPEVMFPLQVITVGPAGASSVSFTNIPNTYTHLQVRILTRSTFSASSWPIFVQPNSSSSSIYAYHDLSGDGSTASASASSTQTLMQLGDTSAASGTANSFGVFILDILDYANTNKNKTARTLYGFDLNGSGKVGIRSGLWASTTAISSLAFGTGGDFAANSTFALYGIKAAS